jgi:hypothetical protein
VIQIHLLGINKVADQHRAVMTLNFFQDFIFQKNYEKNGEKKQQEEKKLTRHDYPSIVR